MLISVIGLNRYALLLIANSDPSDKPGSHWVAIKHTHSGEDLWFDSFGMPHDAEDNILHEQPHFHKWLRVGTIDPLHQLRSTSRPGSTSRHGRVGSGQPHLSALAFCLPTDRRHVSWWGGGTRHVRETREAKKTPPLMKDSTIDRDERFKRLFAKWPSMVVGVFAQPVCGAPPDADTSRH